MNANRLIPGVALMALMLIQVGCGDKGPGAGPDKAEQIAIKGADAAPRRDAVAASKLQNRGGVIYVVNGQQPLTGMAQDFYGTGQMKWEIEIEDGNLVRLKRWHKNGVLYLACGFTEGTLRDVEITAYDLIKLNYSRLNGDLTAFFNTGQKWCTATFKNGKPTGEMAFWNSNGNLTGKACYDSSGLTLLEQYNENGALIGKTGFKAAHYNMTFCDVNSKTRELSDSLHGEYERFYANGQRSEHGIYNNGQLIGNLKKWSPSGRPIETMTVQSLGMEMIRVAAGNFMMGPPHSNDDPDDKSLLRSVTISKDYWLGRYEVTQREWMRVMDNNPSKNQTNDLLPLESIGWDAAMKFCQKVTEIERQAGRLPAGYIYRLPTQAEWEYAARGGTNSGSYRYTYSGSDNINEVAWHSGNSGNKTHLVGMKSANILGLHDMSGNVMEWCRDKYQNYYTESVTIDPVGPPSGLARKACGGGWDNKYCRVENSGWWGRLETKDSIGFRMALGVPLGETGPSAKRTSTLSKSTGKPAGIDLLPESTKNHSAANEIAVWVDDAGITGEQIQAEVKRLFSRIPKDVEPEQLPVIQMRLLQKAVDNLVVRQLVQAGMERSKIHISRKDLEKAKRNLESGLDNGGSLQTYLAAANLTMEELEMNLRLDLFKNKVLKEKQTAAIEAVTDKAVRTYYDENPKEFTKAEGRLVSHILVRVPKDADVAKVADCSARAEGIRLTLMKGADFEKLAAEKSECGSRTQGGNLGVIPRGRESKKFEEAVYSQEIGAIGEVVQSPVGFHIIKVTGEQQRELVPFREVQMRLKAALRKKARQQVVADYVKELREKATIKLDGLLAKAVDATKQAQADDAKK